MAAIGPAESDVLDPERDGIGSSVGAWFGIFANAEQIVEGNVDEVGSGGLLGGVWGVGPVLTENVFGNGDRDGKLRFRGRVLAFVSMDHVTQ